MGVERAVTRWYVRRQSILNAITDLETQISRIEADQKKTEQTPAEAAVQMNARLSQQLEQARAKLRELGPCPQPMMG